MDTPESFGQRLRQERRRLNFTQSDFAEVTHVSTRSQINYEKDVCSPDAGYLTQAQKAGIDTTYVLSGNRSFNWERHDQVLDIIDTYLGQTGHHLPFDKKMDLLRLHISALPQSNPTADRRFILITLDFIFE